MSMWQKILNMNVEHPRGTMEYKVGLNGTVHQDRSRVGGVKCTEEQVGTKKE